MTQPTIRFDKPSDMPRIVDICAAAFGGEREARAFERLRQSEELIALLVAELGDTVVGAAAFSEMPVEARDTVIRAAALAPLVVDPETQAGGVGSAMVRAGLAQCRKKGVEAVVVLGYRGFYERFGFTVEAAAGIESPWSGPNLMALALRDETPPLVGTARYAAAFEAETDWRL